MTAPLLPVVPPDKSLISCREARRVTRQLGIGIGALLLAAVDDWNRYVAGYNAPMRTALTPLARGTHIAAMLAASIDVWLDTPNMHPPRHLAYKPFRWPEISCGSKVYMVVHHNEMEPSNSRRTAFRRQDTDFLLIEHNPTLCELTWDYDLLTDSKVTRIRISAPLPSTQVWFEFEVPLKAAQSQYDKWAKRSVRWLPAASPLGTASPPMAIPETEHPLPDISIPPKPDAGTDTEDVQDDGESGLVGVS